MAETNGDGRLDDHEVRLTKLEAARAEIEDTLVVMAHLETKAAARAKEHAEFTSAHEAALRSFEKRMEKQEERTAQLDARVDKLVSSLGELIARIPPNALVQ